MTINLDELERWCRLIPDDTPERAGLLALIGRLREAESLLKATRHAYDDGKGMLDLQGDIDAFLRGEAV